MPTTFTIVPNGQEPEPAYVGVLQALRQFALKVLFPATDRGFKSDNSEVIVSNLIMIFYITKPLILLTHQKSAFYSDVCRVLLPALLVPGGYPVLLRGRLPGQ